MFNSQSNLRLKLLSLFLVSFVFYIGYTTPLPFINTELVGYYSGNTFGILGVPLENTTSVFALGIIPYVTASIIFSLLNVVIPKVKNLNTGTDTDKSKIRMITFIASIIIASSQFFILKNYWLSQEGVYFGDSLADDLTVFLILISGFIVLVLLSSLVSKLSLVNGSSFILLLTLILGFRHSAIFLNGRPSTIIAVLLITLSLLFIVSFASLSFIKINIIKSTYPVKSGQLPLLLKAFSTGIAPLIFAAAVTGLVTLVYPDITNQTFMYYSVLLIVTIFLSFIWAKNTYDPLSITNTLTRNNLLIEGVIPGLPSALKINSVINFTAIISALVVSYSFVAFNLISFQFLQGVSVTLFVVLSIDFLTKTKKEFYNKNLI